MTRAQAGCAALALGFLACLPVAEKRVFSVANAQTPANTAAALPGMTHLHLAATGSVPVTPDELVATLAAEATSPSLAIAQNRVNILMKRGLSAAGAVTGVEARAEDYSVQQVDQSTPIGVGGRPLQHPAWVAHQTLKLRSSSGDPLLDLAGKLQADGFTVSALEWRVSSSLARKSRDAAMVEALKDLQSRAHLAAAALGLHVDHIQDVRVDIPEAMPVRPMMAAQARAMVAPEETRSSQDITSEASADVLLRP
jgi:uncharacterized protein YggE